MAQEMAERPAPVSEMTATPHPTPAPPPAPASLEHQDPTAATFIRVSRPAFAARAADDRNGETNRSGPLRAGVITIGLLALFAVGVMLDAPVSERAYHLRIFTGIHGVRAVLNLFGHAGTTIALVGVLLIVYRAPRAAGLLAGTALVEGIIAHLIKWCVGRTRPWYAGSVGSPFNFHPFAGGPFGWVWDAGSPSFPSGHAGVAFVNAACLAFLFPRARIYFFGLAALAAMTRVMQGAHWPSDTVAGAICAVLSFKLVAAQMRRHAIIPEQHLSLPHRMARWTSRGRAPAALGMLAIVVFAGAIMADRIVTSHEARVALTAQTMADSGWPWHATRVNARAGKGSTLSVNPWIIPVFQGDIRLQKPPLPYWCAAVLMRLGWPMEWAARFTPALLALLAIPLLIELAQRTSGRAAAAIIGWVWISTFVIVNELRRAMADPYLTFFVLAAVVSWIRSAAWTRRSANVKWIVFFWLAVALACLSKGPVALLHVGIALAALVITSPRFRPTAAVAARPLVIAHLLGFGLLLLIALPWPLAVIRTLPHVVEIWRYETVGEFADNTRNARPWWYYGPMLVQLALPWIAFVVIGVMLAASRGRHDVRHRRGLFPLLWIAATVLVFSFVHMKKAAYLLPIMPVMALLAAKGVAAVAAYLRRPAKSRETALIILRASGAIIIACAGVAIAVVALRYGMWHPGTAWVTVGRISVAVAAMSAAGIACLPKSIAHRRWFEIQAAGVAVLIVLMLLVSGAYNPLPREPYSESSPGAVEAAVIVRGDVGP